MTAFAGCYRFDDLRTRCPASVDVLDENGQKVAVAQVMYMLLDSSK
jgi:hypothetical protein